jgi:hypothetical protein
MESSINNNPLAKHFRQPSIYLKLPSGGRFYPEGTLELGATGQVPIYPMTVKDELLLKTPDALLNGSSVAGMIASCCPAIKDPWEMPLVDLDPVLIAIRLASYGEGMDMTSNCTNCKESNEHTINLHKVLDSLKAIGNYDKSNFINGLVFDIQPHSFKEINTASQIAFEQQKLVAAVENSDLTPEQKKEQFEASFTKLTELNIESLVSCIRGITTEDGVVVKEKALIKDFLANTDRKNYDEIKETVMNIVKANALDPVTVACDHCEKEYNVALDFNQTNFFA